VASVDGYGASKATQQIFYAASGLSDGPHTLKIVVTGQKNPASTGYVVVPPSIHPDSGRPYAWIEAPIAQPPQWLVDLVRQPTPVLQSTVRRRRKVGGTSIADAFTTSKTWAHILQPQGWRCIDPDGDGDGARWLHPAATSACSATVRHGCLFIYSPNTPFEITEPGDVHGYTRFRAWAVLNNRGDLSAAAKHLKSMGAL
jgi:Bifunctional DNA primase/polymerase, N-terminal